LNSPTDISACSIPAAASPRWRPSWLLLLALGATGCPEQVSKDAPTAAAPCKELGQNCEVSPGKLGSCVLVDGCRTGNCFVCQSQH
jgi:hypothetical protein